ncbi:hypothetical protein R6Q57_020109 [Mikania cordata]
MDRRTRFQDSKQANYPHMYLPINQQMGPNQQFQGQLLCQPMSQNQQFQGELLSQPMGQNQPFRDEPLSQPIRPNQSFQGQPMSQSMGQNQPFQGQPMCQSMGQNQPFECEPMSRPMGQKQPFQGHCLSHPMVGQSLSQSMAQNLSIQGKHLNQPMCQAQPFLGQPLSQTFGQNQPFQADTMNQHMGQNQQLHGQPPSQTVSHKQPFQGQPLSQPMCQSFSFRGEPSSQQVGQNIPFQGEPMSQQGGQNIPFQGEPLSQPVCQNHRFQGELRSQLRDPNQPGQGEPSPNIFSMQSSYNIDESIQVPENKSHVNFLNWTDEMARLLIIALSYITEPEPFEFKDEVKKFKLLSKMTMWKVISTVMNERGFNVSPQQCEEKFRDLNNKYKQMIGLLGRATSCNVVENPILLGSINMPENKKQEVRKLLNSEHFLYREMCSFHHGNRMFLPHDWELRRAVFLNIANNCDDHLKTQQGNRNETGQNQIESKVLSARWVEAKQKSLEIQEQRLQFEKARFEWLCFNNNEDLKLENMRLENKSLKLENAKLAFEVKRRQKFSVGENN